MDTPSLEKFAIKQEAVRTWIEKVVGIPIEVNNFWTTMKYGEILCLLMLEIKEKYVPDHSYPKKTNNILMLGPSLPSTAILNFHF